MRTTNLIQSYVQGYPTTNQYNSDRIVKDFDVNKELANRTFIKPLPNNGKLVRPSIFDIPSEIRKDIIYDTKALGHAVKGEANDHELGRINDVGMKLGGLAIAAYLFTKKQTPMTKVFEFIGLGTFFAAMDLWPKLFIQLPAYLIHGVNVRQQYEDSFGRKKMFYQDHQFIPWDLYSEQEINKIGDRLNVPKDIPNRREFIQEKMRKIALQNNTLWMLTAGFATPVMSALMCNMLEKPIAKYLTNIKDKKADKLIDNFSEEVKKYNFANDEKLLQEILNENNGKALTSETVETISKIMTKDLDYMISQAFAKDLRLKLPVNDKYIFTSDSIDEVIKAIQKTYEPLKLSEQDLAKIVPDKQRIAEELNNKGLLDSSFKDFSEHSKVIQKLMKERIDSLNGEGADPTLIKKLEFYKKKLIHANEIGADSDLFRAFKHQSAVRLTPEISAEIKKMAKALNKLKAEHAVLEKYAFIKVGQAPETSLADAWNTASEEIFKALKFTPEEIKRGRLDREIAGEILRGKIEDIASDKNAYKEFIEVVKKSLESLNHDVSKIRMVENPQTKTYTGLSDDIFKTAASFFNSKGMRHTVISLVGYDESHGTSALAMMREFVENRTLGVKSSFYRLLNMADLYHRVATMEGSGILSENMPREIKEECVELAKQLSMDAHSSDYAVKFWQKRNPQPNKSDTSQIEVVNGKVKNKYFGKTPSHKLAELSNDREYFKKVMQLMFGDAIHPDTLQRLEDSGFTNDFKQYREQSLHILGSDPYFAKPHHLVDFKPTESTSLFRFLLTGSATDEMAYKYFNQTFNGKTWFSMFGKLGAVLAAGTILAQFFFGRMKNPKTQPQQEVK